MKKKIIGLILWSSLAAGILAGCGNKDNVEQLCGWQQYERQRRGRRLFCC